MIICIHACFIVQHPAAPCVGRSTTTSTKGNELHLSIIPYHSIYIYTIDTYTMDKDCKGRSAQIESKEVRRMVTKLRGGTAHLRIETGRWKGEGREERKCKVGKKWRMQSTSF